MPEQHRLAYPALFVAILAGWTTTEVGRQPWVVYGVLRTADAVSKHPASALGLTLVLFVVAYIFVFGTGTVYLLRMMRKGPQRFELHRPLTRRPPAISCAVPRSPKSLIRSGSIFCPSHSPPPAMSTRPNAPSSMARHRP